ncbi:MAG: glycosyl transferase [Denitrovibrio sp.]|nr:MAG: glycosyl transferase [Denitrovibrio sp.]
MDELVSIILPMYNDEKFIKEAVSSVLSQTYENWEMIIIDDASTENSLEIIEDFASNDSRIRVFSFDKNKGLSEARNKAIEEAGGKYIAFLDSDDLWLPEKLERQIDFMKENNLPFNYSSYFLIDSLGDDIGKFITKRSLTYKDILKTCSIGMLTVVYDAEKIGKRPFELVHMREDYLLWLSIVKELKVVYGILEPLAKYRVRGRSVSSNKLKAAAKQWRVYRDHLGYSFVRSLYYFVHYAFFGIKKHYLSFIRLNANKITRTR